MFNVRLNMVLRMCIHKHTFTHIHNEIPCLTCDWTWYWECAYINTHSHTYTMRYHVQCAIFNLWQKVKINNTRQILNLDREQGQIFSYTGDNAPFASAGLKRAYREHTVRETDSSGVEISNYGSEETETENEKQKVQELCVRSQTCVLLPLWFHLKVWTELSETVRKTKNIEGETEPEKQREKKMYRLKSSIYCTAP